MTPRSHRKHLLQRVLPILAAACLAAACVAGPLEHPGVTPGVGEPAAFAGTLAAHNRWRATVGTPALGWSDAAAQVAQRWAEQLANDDCRPRHSPGEQRRRTWGENIYSYWRGGDYQGFRKTPASIVDAWAGEQQWYTHAGNRCDAPAGAECGHYTQVVSTYSTHVGCGRARAKACEVWVCNYFPPGNFRDLPPY